MICLIKSHKPFKQLPFSNIRPYSNAKFICHPKDQPIKDSVLKYFLLVCISMGLILSRTQVGLIIFQIGKMKDKNELTRGQALNLSTGFGIYDLTTQLIVILMFIIAIYAAKRSVFSETSIQQKDSLLLIVSSVYTATSIVMTLNYAFNSKIFNVFGLPVFMDISLWNVFSNFDIDSAKYICFIIFSELTRVYSHVHLLNYQSRDIFSILSMAMRILSAFLMLLTA